MSESWPDPEFLPRLQEAARLHGRAMAVKSDALRAAAEARTLAQLQAEGFNGIGVLCNRCAHAANLAIYGELRKLKGLTLGEFKERLLCMRTQEQTQRGPTSDATTADF